MYTGKSGGMIQIIFDDSGIPIAISPAVPTDNDTIKTDDISPDC